MNTANEKKQKKQFKMINSVALLFIIIIVAAIITHIIPGGTFERTVVDGKTVLDPNSFHYIESNPASFFDVFRAVPYGLTASAMLMVGTLMIGGALEVIQATNSISVGISKIISKIGTKRGDWILVAIFYVFAAMGGFLGFIEGAIPFIPLAIALALGLGYDTVTGVAIALMGAMTGFACGPTNPLTVGIAQGMAGLPMFSGLGLRVVLFIVMTAVTVHHILRYSRRVKADKAYSLVKEIDTNDLCFDVEEYNRQKFTLAHGLILLTLVGSMGLFLYGALNWGWYFNELGALFLLDAIVAGILSKMSIDTITNTFMKGAAAISGGAIIIGVARGIEWILNQSSVIDTVIYHISTPLSNLSPIVAALAMLVVICIINFFIPSGSGKAVVLMPIILPMASIIGITQQTAILAYQLGDGITNACYPTLGVVLLAIAFGRVPFDKWFKFVTPLVGKLIVISAAFLIFAVQSGYGPF